MIEVLKQALDLVVESKHYAEECSHMATRNDCDHFDAVAENLRQAIKELESQEPKAWMYVYKRSDGKGKKFLDRKAETPNGGWKIYDEFPLYTHPPQRTWQGLTHEQVDSWELPDCPTVFEFAQFIEAKLKQKNGFAEEKNT